MKSKFFEGRFYCALGQHAFLFVIPDLDLAADLQTTVLSIQLDLDPVHCIFRGYLNHFGATLEGRLHPLLLAL